MLKPDYQTLLALGLLAVALAGCRVDSPVERPHNSHYNVTVEGNDSIPHRGSLDDSADPQDIAIVAEETDVIPAKDASDLGSGAPADTSADDNAAAQPPAANGGAQAPAANGSTSSSSNTPPASSSSSTSSSPSAGTPTTSTSPAATPPASSTPNPPATGATQPAANTPLAVTANPQIPKGWYKFKGQGSGRCAETPSAADGSAGAFQIYDCQDARPQQRIYIESAGSGFYRLSSMNQTAIQGSATHLADGTALEQAKYAGTDNQLYSFEVSKDGQHYVIKAKNQNLVIDVAGGKTENSTHLQFAYANGGNAQSWTLLSAP